MRKIEVSQLIHDAMDVLTAFRLKPSTLTAYECRSFLPLKVFFDAQEEEFYSTALSADYVATIAQLQRRGEVSHKIRRYREKGVLVSDELFLTGSVVWRMRDEGKASVPACYAEIFKSFSENMKV